MIAMMVFSASAHVARDLSQCSVNIHCVPKKRDHGFDDKLNQNCPFTKISGTPITKTIHHR